MRPLKKFLQLTTKTYPNGHETELIKYLPKGYKIDSFGNYFIKIGDSKTCFTCHLDTADWTQKNVKHCFVDGFVRTDGNSILGADDKAGMTVMLYMIDKKIPGYYFFFIGEEVGCQGSSKLAAGLFKAKSANKIENYPFDKVISFDRRGTNSVITHQMYGRCCSNEFAIELSRQLNEADVTFSYEPDDSGIMTDSAQFTEFISECTNISVGYYNEHTHSESQDIEHLQSLCRAAVKVKWDELPVKRDPDAIDEDYDNDECFDTYLSYGYYDKNKHVYSEFTESNYTNVIDENGETKKVFISKTWIAHETSLIEGCLIDHFEYSRIDWNGSTCWAHLKNGSLELVGSRSELINFIEELEEIPVEHICDSITKTQPKTKKEFLM